METRERAARLEGELDGLKLGTEHLHDRLSQAERAKEEVQRQALEGRAAAEAEKRKREEAEAALARLQGRGLWRRIRNRP
jgi:regulator of replication initiation timing